MKKFLKNLVIIVSALSLTSCGITSMATKNLTQTQVVLSEGNFKVVGQAYGESTATYIFGIGGFSKKALQENAINEMSKNANLRGSQTLTNITTNTSIKMFTPLFMKFTCSATANIIEFDSKQSCSKETKEIKNVEESSVAVVSETIKEQDHSKETKEAKVSTLKVPNLPQMTMESFNEIQAKAEKKDAEAAVTKAFKEKIGILVKVKPVKLGELPRSEKKSTRIFDNRY